MNTIIVENNYSYLKTDDQVLLDTLWNGLRFRDKNYYHNILYKRKLWDGWVNYFDKKTGKFLTGILPEVVMAIKKKGLEYAIQDRRGVVDFINSVITPDFLPGFALRDYQIEYIEKIAKYKRGIVFAPPGAGKTATMISMVKNLPIGTKILILS